MTVQWKVAWVTGASSGIGEALARKLAASGTVVAVSARNAESLKTLEASAPNIHAFPLDVTDAAACTRIIAEIEDQLGPVDLAVFCAGTWDIIDIEDIAVEPMVKGMTVNY
ncbi:MAG: SDR family NAD(P)-dependent oxidoreductase, partial [Pseudomonadota bacterium]